MQLRWADGSPDSWENEDNLSQQLIAAFEQSKQGGGSQAALLPELPEGAVAKPKKKQRRRRRAKTEAIGTSSDVPGLISRESDGISNTNGNGGGSAHKDVAAGKEGKAERQQEPVAV